MNEISDAIIKLKLLTVAADIAKNMAVNKEDVAPVTKFIAKGLWEELQGSWE